MRTDRKLDRSLLTFLLLGLALVAGLAFSQVAMGDMLQSKDGDVIQSRDGDVIQSKDEDVISVKFKALALSKDGDVLRSETREPIGPRSEEPTQSLERAKGSLAVNGCPYITNYYMQDAEYAPFVTSIPVTPTAFYPDVATTNGVTGTRTDYSGVAHDIVSKQLLVVDNQFNLIDVYDADDQFVKTIFVNFTSDLEDIAWMDLNTYALIDEDTNKIHVVEITPQTVVLNTSDILFTIDTCLPLGASGIEGIGFDFTSFDTNAMFFYVAWKGKAPDTPKIYEYRRFKDGDNDPTNNPVVQFGPLDLGDIMQDAAAVYFQSIGSPGFPNAYGDYLNLYVLSELDKTIYRIDSFYSGNVISTVDVSNFDMPEGLAFSLTMDEMFVVGEEDQLSRFTVQ